MKKTGVPHARMNALLNASDQPWFMYHDH